MNGATHTLAHTLGQSLGPDATPAATPPGRESVRSLTLANGMKIIVWPVGNIPNVALYNWVRAGSRNEAPGITGLAHFFEHMMFNGTARRKPGDFDKLMEAQGGANNAFTSDDITVYQDWFPRDALELIFELESDRIAHLAFDPEVIESERGVVASERRLSVDDNNHGHLAEQVQAAAFVAHPYRFLDDRLAVGHSVLAAHGSAEVLPHLLRAEQPDFEDRRRCVAGRSVRARAQVSRAHSAPGRARACACHRAGAGGRAPHRRKARCADATDSVRVQGTGGIGCAGPALNLLMSILVDGDASRLYRELAENREVIIDLGGHWHEGFDPALLWLYFTLPEGSDPDQVQPIIDAELARIAEAGITAEELRRAKNMAAVSFWKKLATIDGKAQLLGEYEIFHGDWAKLSAQPRSSSASPRMKCVPSPKRC